jgi:hypothetical protein
MIGKFIALVERDKQEAAMAGGRLFHQEVTQGDARE